MIKGLINKIRGRFEHKKMLSFYENIDSSRIYFVMSTGRTGTNFMESFLSAVSNDVYCKHEPKPDLFNLSTKKFRSPLQKDELLNQLRSARHKGLQDFLASGKSLYIESNPFSSFLVNELAELFPKAKFVFISRDIESYLLSAINKSPIDDGNNNFYGEDDPRKRLTALDFNGDAYIEKWPSFERSQRITWYWQKCNQELVSFNKAHKTRSLWFSFEKLFDKTNQNDSWETFLSFLGLALPQKPLATQEKRNQTKDKYIDSLSSLSKKEINSIIAISAQTRKDLGYLSALKLSEI